MPIVTRKAEIEEKLMQLIVFCAGNEEFCVPIDAVLEIIKAGSITPIPDAPNFMKGIINVRGEIVAVIDLKKRFVLPDMKGRPMGKHIIISKQENSLFGLMVDEVLEVLRVRKGDVNKAPSLILKMYEGYVNEIVTHEERLIILLDLSKVLSQDDLVQLSNGTRTFHHKNSMADENTITTALRNIQTAEAHSDE